MTSLHRLSAVGIVAFMLCVSGSTIAFGQLSWELGLKGGVGVTKLTGDDTKGSLDFSEPGFSLVGDGDSGDSKLGFVGGGYATIHVTDQFGVRLEALYFQKGGKGEFSGQGNEQGVGAFDFQGELTFTFDYFELPLLAVVSFPAGTSGTFEVYAGPALAFNTKAELKLELTVTVTDSARAGGTGSVSETEDISDETKGIDFGGVIGAAFVFELTRVNLFFDGRWTYGFTKIDDSTDNADIKNSAFAFMAGVGFPLPTK